MSSVCNTKNKNPRAGSIYRIFLENFVTYREVELYPGPTLNIIIGPNGTGKSTFVNAIILGLCGKPNSIGRMNKVSDYIRTGSDKAIIEIELYQNPGQRNVIIRRTILKNTSKWCIDNNDVDERTVQEYISNFKIQVDNLCQLLPQDRVHDFSKLNPQELLKSTLSAIDIESVNQLECLIDNCVEKRNLKTRLTQIENQLNKLREENERLRGEYEAMLERKEYKKQIHICDLKELWLEYEKLLGDITILQNDKKNSEKILKSFEKKLKDIDYQVRIHSDNMKRVIIERNNFIEKINEAKNTTMLHINTIKSNEDVIKKAELSYKEILSRENNRKNDIDTERLTLDKLRNDKKNLENKAGIESELQRSSDELALILNGKDRTIINKEKRREEARQNNQSIKQEIRQYQERIQRLEDMNNNRLKILERYNSDTFQAVTWFEKNSHLFPDAYKPMMLVLEFEDPQYAAHVEATVPRRDLLAFTFTRADDMNRFLRAVRAPPPGLALRAVGAVCAPPAAPAPPARPPPSHLGFHSYLLDKVQAPAAVLRYLGALGLARVPLGNRHTYEHVEKVPPHITCFFTDRHKFTTRTSKYSGAVVRSVQELAPPRLLAAAPDLGALARARLALTRLQQEQEILQENLRVLDAELATLRSEYDKINEKKKSIDININRAKELSVLIKNKEKNIQSMINQPSIENEKALCDKRKIDAVLNQCKLHEKLCKSFKELQDYTVKRQIVTIKLTKYKEKHNEFITKLSKSQNDVKEHKEILNNVEKSLREMTTQANEKKVTLKQKCHNKLPNEAGFPYKKEFANLSNDLEEVQKRRYELETRMSYIISNAQDIENYENNLQKISELEQELSQKRDEEAELKESSNRLKQHWLPGVETIIEGINKNFSEMFHKVQCDGKVSLDKGDSEDEFDKYGIGIWVKFREQSQSMRLTRHTQSGGERALSTALYLLALQRLARVPFRCVDEINQGMDEENERKMLQLVIQATKENSQYFLLSPKLLPNLHYNERVKIHTIMNGKQIMKCKEWNYEKFVKIGLHLQNN